MLDSVRLPGTLLAIFLCLLAVMAPLAGANLVQGMDRTRGEQPDRYFVVFETTPGEAERRIVESSGGEVRHTYTVVPALSAYLPTRTLLALEGNPDIVRIEPVIDAVPDEQEQASAQGYQWGVTNVGAHRIHEEGYFGKGKTVAVLDTGIDENHPHLNVVRGVDCTEPGCPDGQQDGHGHGTHVAGTIAATIDSPVSGVAPGADLYAVKVLRDHDAGGFTDDMLAGIQWAAENAAHITNNSYGFDQEPAGSTLLEAFARTYEDGLLHVSSAGNSGNEAGLGNNVTCPARYDSVIAVAATDGDDERRSTSSTGPSLEITAPGEQIESTAPRHADNSDTSTRKSSGTSMAAPHVSGVAALAWAANPNLSNEAIRELLVETAHELGDADLYGHGLVRAWPAVTAALSAPTSSQDDVRDEIRGAVAFDEVTTPQCAPVEPDKKIRATNWRN